MKYNAGRHPGQAHLRILATTDLHMNLTSFDYYADRPEPAVGMVRTSSLIRAARSEAERTGGLVLLFDNGDMLQGSPMGHWAAEDTSDTHPIMQAFGHLQYDALGLGNHDFCFGLKTLDRILAQAPCPVICSNANRIGEEQMWLRCAVLNRSISLDGATQPIRIGVFSVLPPQTARWEAHRIGGCVSTTDILTSAQQTTAELRKRGCDLVVALAHTGLDGGGTGPDLENAAVPLASLDGIDAVIAGHTHLTLPGEQHHELEDVDWQGGMVHGKSVIQPGAHGSHLGVIDLVLEMDTGTGWQVAGAKTELRPICGTDAQAIAPEDPALARMFAKAHAGTRARMKQPVGRISEPAHSYFSFCAQDHALALVAAGQAAALRTCLAGHPYLDMPLVSATAPTKFGGRSGPRNYTDVPAGEIAMHHVADLHVFPNDLRAVVATGAELRDWLEMSAGLFHRIRPGTETELVDSSRAGHNFDVLFGLTYQIDLTQPARFNDRGLLTDPGHHRIHDLAYNGRPVSDDQRFVVATNNYRASGGGNFTSVSQFEAIDLPPMQIQGILRDYLSGRLPVDPLASAHRPWTFRPMPGQNVILRTGPDAIRYIGELSEYDPEILGQDEHGFLRIRLTL